MFFNKVALIGIGLLGGSLGLALKKRSLCGKIVGAGRSEDSLRAGLEAGAIDEAVAEITDAAAGSELIVVSTPVGSAAGIIAEMDSVLEENCIVTDVGSTKRRVVADVAALPHAGRRFVGSHPLAGSEKKGVRHASAELFEGATIFVTPSASVDPEATGTVKRLWETIGGNVIETTAEAHDRIVARTSHLPHIVAGLLVAGLRTLREEKGGIVGKGFLDTTRIASSDPEMWADICLTNADEIREAMHLLRDDLDEFDLYLSQGEYEKLFEFFASIKHVRDSLNQGSRG